MQNHLLLDMVIIQLKVNFKSRGFNKFNKIIGILKNAISGDIIQTEVIIMELQKTDREYLERFEHFAFDEVVNEKDAFPEPKT